MLKILYLVVVDIIMLGEILPGTLGTIVTVVSASHTKVPVVPIVPVTAKTIATCYAERLFHLLVWEDYKKCHFAKETGFDSFYTLTQVYDVL